MLVFSTLVANSVDFGLFILCKIFQFYSSPSPIHAMALHLAWNRQRGVTTNFGGQCRHNAEGWSLQQSTCRGRGGYRERESECVTPQATEICFRSFLRFTPPGYQEVAGSPPGPPIMPGSNITLGWRGWGIWGGTQKAVYTELQGYYTSIIQYIL